MEIAQTPPQLETENIPANMPPRVVGEGYLQCDFCECRLTKRGEVYQMSDKAKVYRDEKETNAKTLTVRDEEIARLHSEISAKDAQIAALTNSPSSKKRFLG
jgi:hypothetical protein